MSSSTSSPDKAQKLMFLQGISLIHDGLQFIEWAEKMPNELSYDFFMILTDRFQMFRESLLDGQHRLFIDRPDKHPYGRRKARLRVKPANSGTTKGTPGICHEQTAPKEKRYKVNPYKPLLNFTPIPKNLL